MSCECDAICVTLCLFSAREQTLVVLLEFDGHEFRHLPRHVTAAEQRREKEQNRGVRRSGDTERKNKPDAWA